MNHCEVCCATKWSAVGTIYRARDLPTAVEGAEATLYRCDGCGFRWIHPTLDEEALLAGYRMIEAGAWGGAVESDHIERRQFVPKARLLASLAPQRHAALDVGCFRGDFVSLLDCEERWGIEISSAAASVARQRGVNVIEDNVFDAAPPREHFDIISCFDVVEHVTDQRGLAARLADWLKPGGIVAIETGNADCLVARAMGARWYYYALSQHLCAHTARSLDLAMGSAGLELVHCKHAWHQPPQSQLRAFAYVGTALTHRVASDILVSLDSACIVPSPVMNLAKRPSPQHYSRDHLWRVYRRAAG
ncbi:MAG: class I SAM-dependent methyltransferase [Myxococcales bacterium]|nr:class I SAM-dependent methyltransferase [Myxococcales bacterium]